MHSFFFCEPQLITVSIDQNNMFDVPKACARIHCFDSVSFLQQFVLLLLKTPTVFIFKTSSLKRQGRKKIEKVTHAFILNSVIFSLVEKVKQNFNICLNGSSLKKFELQSKNRVLKFSSSAIKQIIRKYFTFLCGVAYLVRQ